MEELLIVAHTGDRLIIPEMGRGKGSAPVFDPLALLPSPEGIEDAAALAEALVAFSAIEPEPHAPLKADGTPEEV